MAAAQNGIDMAVISVCRFGMQEMWHAEQNFVAGGSQRVLSTDPHTRLLVISAALHLVSCTRLCASRWVKSWLAATTVEKQCPERLPFLPSRGHPRCGGAAFRSDRNGMRQYKDDGKTWCGRSGGTTDERRCVAPPGRHGILRHRRHLRRHLREAPWPSPSTMPIWCATLPLPFCAFPAPASHSQLSNHPRCHGSFRAAAVTGMRT